MKKIFTLAVCCTLLLSSCGTYTGSGAYMGTSLGGILGSAIGGLAGGPRGSDVGTIVGMASGAIVGAAVGSAAEQKEQTQRQEDLAQYRRDKAERQRAREQRQNSQYGYGQDYSSNSSTGHLDSGFDANNSGDDRLYDFTSSDYTGNYTAQQPTTVAPSATVEELGTAYLDYSPTLEIVNARFVDANQDGQINRGETCKLIFEIMNRGKQTVYDVVPTVVEVTGNKNIYISPNIHVERIAPGKGIRYTAMIQAGSRLKEGKAKFCVSVVHENKAISKINEFNITTTKK